MKLCNFVALEQIGNKKRVILLVCASHGNVAELLGEETRRVHIAHSAQSQNSRNINPFHKLRHRGGVHPKKGAFEMQYVDNI